MTSKIIKIGIITLLAIGLAGCYMAQKHYPLPYNAHKHYSPKYVATGKLASEKTRVASFDSIVVSGEIELELKNGPAKIEILYSPDKMMAHQIKVIDHTLFLSRSSFKSEQYATVRVTVPNLNSLRASGSARVYSKNLISGGLVVVADSYGSITLEGKIKLFKVIQNGYGKVDVRWITSPGLVVESNAQGPIYLAGVATTLLATLHNGAKLDARYLRVNAAEIIAIDGARADVMPLNKLNAYAINKSNIFYYKFPPRLTVVTKDKGAVLHSDWMH